MNLIGIMYINFSFQIDDYEETKFVSPATFRINDDGNDYIQSDNTINRMNNLDKGIKNVYIRL